MQPQHTIDAMLTTGQARQILGVGPTRILQLIESGQLAAVKKGRFYLVATDDLAAFKKARRAVRKGRLSSRTLAPLRAQGLLPPFEVAAVLGMSRGQVYRLMQGGKLPTVVTDGWRLVHRDALYAFKEQQERDARGQDLARALQQARKQALVGLLTQRGAARELGVSHQRVGQLVTGKRIATVDLDGRLYIRREDLDAFKAKRSNASAAP